MWHLDAWHPHGELWVGFALSEPRFHCHPQFPGLETQRQWAPSEQSGCLWNSRAMVTGNEGHKRQRLEEDTSHTESCGYLQAGPLLHPWPGEPLEVLHHLLMIPPILYMLDVITIFRAGESEAQGSSLAT